MEITIEKNHHGQQTGAQALKNLKIVRVAVYARVSTDKEIQIHSLEEQMKSFQVKIGQHPGWALVDVYADEGISGTSVKKRKEFLRMMEDCEAGRVDYIMTKSVSRFARNTVECLSYVRHLKSLGVQVYFEKEGVDTGTAISELILTVMAGFAQEESRSISENLKWGIRKRFEKGETRWCRTYGYRKTEDGEIVIDPAEAEIVRMVFNMYQKGTTIPAIQAKLNGIPTASGGEKWNKTELQYLLQSEKYIGDAKLQKWISSDHISHRSVRNDATIVPSYYAKNHHAPIVDRHTYEQVQRIMELRAPRIAPSRYPYYDTEIICPLCGKRMTTGIMHAKDNKRIIGCFGEGGCEQYAVKSYLVDAAMLEAYNTLKVESITGNDDASRLMLEMKAEQPTLDEVHYYWLDDLVERLEFENDDLKIFWKCGLESRVALHTPKGQLPERIAASHRASRERTTA